MIGITNVVERASDVMAKIKAGVSSGVEKALIMFVNSQYWIVYKMGATRASLRDGLGNKNDWRLEAIAMY